VGQCQRDGRPAEHRRRRLFNAAVWLTPTTRVPCSNAAKMRNQLKFAGVPQTNRLAEKTNISIQDIRSRQYNKLAQASPKELWAAVKSTNWSVTQAQYPVDVFHDVESVNNFFASTYSATDVTCFKRLNLHSCSSNILLQPYEVEHLLSTMRASSLGLHNIPHWFFRACSYEIAEIVMHILNLSFDTGTVPKHWLNAIVTPVPKVAKPDSIADYRPISLLHPCFQDWLKSW